MAINKILIIVMGGLAVAGAITSIDLYIKNKKLKHNLAACIAAGEVTLETLQDYMHRYDFLKQQIEQDPGKKK